MQGLAIALTFSHTQNQSLKKKVGYYFHENFELGEYICQKVKMKQE